jgi:zinc transport system substrate-binding protein
MARIALVAQGVLLAFIVAACVVPEPGGEEPRVVASIPPLAAIAAAVRAEDVGSFLPPGGNPHQFEPRPSDVRRAGEADLLVTVGLGLDDWVREALEATRHSPVEILRCADHVTLLPLVEHSGHSGETRGPSAAHGSVESGADPHFWLDPLEAAQVGVAIGEALARQDPARAVDYQRRAAAFRERMHALDGELRELLAPVRGTRFVATHAGWAYFARRYGLEQAGVVETAPGREPGPRTLMRLAALVRSEGVSAVIAEVQLADGSARVLSEAAGIPILRLDPFGGPGIVGRESYEDLLRWNARRIAEALRPEGERHAVGESGGGALAKDD